MLMNMYQINDRKCCKKVRNSFGEWKYSGSGKNNVKIGLCEHLKIDRNQSKIPLKNLAN